MEGIAAGMQQLHQHTPVGVVDGIGDLTVLAGECTRHLRAARRETARAIRGEPAGDQQPRTAASALAQVRREVREIARVVLEAHVHRAHDDAVAHPEWAEVQRGQQRGRGRR